MNHFLVSVLGLINCVIAIAIIAFFATLGGSQWSGGQLVSEGGVLGFIVGLVIAALVCGILAIAISIEQSLKQLAGNTKQPNGRRVFDQATPPTRSNSPQAPIPSRWEKTYGPTGDIKGRVLAS
jgi:uncharacterized membrane protein